LDVRIAQEDRALRIPRRGEHLDESYSV